MVQEFITPHFYMRQYGNLFSIHFQIWGISFLSIFRYGILTPWFISSLIIYTFTAMHKHKCQIIKFATYHWIINQHKCSSHNASLWTLTKDKLISVKWVNPSLNSCSICYIQTTISTITKLVINNHILYFLTEINIPC